jgi:hypothetical protein
MSGFMDKAKGLAAEAKEKAEELAAEAKEKAEEFSGKASELLDKAGDHVPDSVKDTVRKVGDKIEEFLPGGKDAEATAAGDQAPAAEDTPGESK